MIRLSPQDLMALRLSCIDKANVPGISVEQLVEAARVLEQYVLDDSKDEKAEADAA